MPCDVSTDADDDLLDLLSRGEAAGAERLCTRFGDRLWWYVTRLVGRRPDVVADIVQETLLSVVRSLSQYDPDRGSLWGWLSRIAHNETVNWARRTRRDDRLTDPNWIGRGKHTELARWFLEGTGSEDPLEQEETTELVREILRELPDDYTDILLAKYLDDLSAEEIATRRGDTVSAVRSRLSRAREAFRDTFRHRTRGETVSIPEGEDKP